MNDERINDDLTLEVGGRAITGWSKIQVTRGIEKLPSSFELSLMDRYRVWPTLENWPMIELPELPQWLLIEAVNQGFQVPVWPPEVNERKTN